VAIEDRPHPLQVAVGRDEDPVRAGDRLEDERGDRRGALQLDRLLEVGQRFLDGVPASLDAVVWVEHVNDARCVLVGPAPRVAGGLHGGPRRTVIGAIARQDLRPARHRSRDLDRVLVGVGAGEGEEHLVHVAGQELG
jgi:hypothetical protein